MNKPPLLLTNILVFIITGAIALIATPLWIIENGISTAQIVAAVVLFFFTGMSITAGYHRLWSHKAYQAKLPVRVILAIGGAMALQNSILHWASDHRQHHRHVDDNDKDPYSAKRGLWFSHIGWMLREYQGNRYTDYSNCKDLQKDNVVMWQHNHYLPIVLVANFGITGLLGWLAGDIIGMILIAGVLRLVVVHHVTFFINSLAHFWGSQPFTDKNTARDNAVLAWFTFGEGYHNFHHIFEYDYRNGIRWWQYDPTKWLIKGLSYIGQTTNLRTCPDERIEKARAEMQLQRTRLTLSKLPNAEEVLQKVHKEYDILMQRMSDYYAMKKKHVNASKEKFVAGMEKLELEYRYKELRQAFILQKEKWAKLQQHPLSFA